MGARQAWSPRLLLLLGAAKALLPSHMLQAGGRVRLLLLGGGAVGRDPILPLLLLLLLLVERVQVRVLLVLLVLLVLRVVGVLPPLAAPVQLLQLAPLVHQQDALLQLAARAVLQGRRGGGRENAG